jgi:hypothetical protein
MSGGYPDSLPLNVCEIERAGEAASKRGPVPAPGA